MRLSGRLHGTYIHDFPAFRFVRRVERMEARSILEASPFVAREDYDQTREYMFLNKGFFIVTNDGTTSRALYLADGNYYLYEAPTSELPAMGFKTWADLAPKEDLNRAGTACPQKDNDHDQ